MTGLDDLAYTFSFFLTPHLLNHFLFFFGAAAAVIALSFQYARAIWFLPILFVVPLAWELLMGHGGWFDSYIDLVTDWASIALAMVLTPIYGFRGWPSMTRTTPRTAR